LAKIAAEVRISPTYFSRLFKRAIGSSPHQYVIQQRVERAKVLLKTTDLAIAQFGFLIRMTMIFPGLALMISEMWQHTIS
jgi:AraC family transcriptional regulator